MEFVEFSYTSRATDHLPPAARLRIAREARLFNTRFDLTGKLRFEGGRFWQVIEGPCAVVLPLSARILADLRHRDIAVKAFRAISARRFASWSAVGFDAPCLEMASGAEVQALRALALPAEQVIRAPIPAHLRMG